MKPIATQQEFDTAIAAGERELEPVVEVDEDGDPVATLAAAPESA